MMNGHALHRDVHACDRGSVVLVALAATMILSALGVGLMMLTGTETTIASNFREANQTLYAADAALELAVSEVLTAPSCNDVLSGGATSAFLDTTLTPILRSNAQVDLPRMTAALQLASDSTAVWGPNNPRWKLYAYGPLSGMAPALARSPEYVVVWVGDDPSEDDGDPAADTNGVLTVLAQAIGLRGTYRTIEATVARRPGLVGPASGRILSWREVR